jgi:hypothetical protein
MRVHNLGSLVAALSLCFIASSSLAATVDVRSFGATGNGMTDDGPAIQLAISSAAMSSPSIVNFPTGRYRVTQAIRPEYNNITLQGKGDAVIIADPDFSGGGATFPEAILVHAGYPGPPQPVHNVTILNLAVEVLNGFNGTVSAAAIQLNNCIGCTVDGIHMVYTGDLPKPSQLDGIATSQGTSGEISNCIVDGIPKAGIYAAGGTQNFTIRDCEVLHASGPFTVGVPATLGRTGFSIVGTSVRVIHCGAHDNELNGLLITLTGTDTTPVSIPADVQLQNCNFSNNGAQGIALKSAYDGVVPSNIRVDNVTLQSNGEVGLLIEAADGLVMTGGSATGNGYTGIFVDNTPIPPNYQPLRTRSISFLNVDVADNAQGIDVLAPGIGLRAATEVSISGGKISRSDPASQQHFGVGLYRSQPPFNASCSLIRITDVDTLTGIDNPAATIDPYGFNDPLAAATSGYYRIAFGVDPEGFLAAPAGSQYTNVNTAVHFFKFSGIGPTGWIVAGP